MKIRTIIVDDEPMPRGLLKLILEKEFAGLVHIVDQCSSVEEAVISIETHKPELVFLDIEMPVSTGFKLFERLNNKIFFEVIFTTAHSKYAVDAFRVDALDYLLKPVNPDDLRKAVIKAMKKISEKSQEEKNEAVIQEVKKLTDTPKIGIPTLQGVIIIEVSSIITAEASSNYTILNLESKKKIIASRTLKDIEEALEPHAAFVRAHKSYIINVNKMVSFTKGDNGTATMTDGSEIPLNKNSREHLEKKLNII
jgi:two-component system LytT family response regulator